MEELLDKIAIAFIVFFAILFSCANNEVEAQNIEPLRRTVDLKIGETAKVELSDGSEPVTVHSNTGYNDNVLDYLGLDNTLLRDDHCLEGYAQAVHRFEKPGHYIIKVTHTANTGYTATAYLHVTVPDEIGVRN